VDASEGGAPQGGMNTSAGEGRTTRVLVAVPIVVVIVMDALYVAIVVNQNSQGLAPPNLYTFPFIVAYLAVMAVLLTASLMSRRTASARTALRAAAAGGLLVLGVVAMFSIGLPLVIAGAMATVATVRTMLGHRAMLSAVSAGAAAAIAVAVLIAGFEVTQRLIVCPEHGTMGGGGSGFVTGPYQYECVEGKLSFHSG
jgi:hypothetical protein